MSLLQVPLSLCHILGPTLPRKLTEPPAPWPTLLAPLHTCRPANTACSCVPGVPCEDWVPGMSPLASAAAWASSSSASRGIWGKGRSRGRVLCVALTLLGASERAEETRGAKASQSTSHMSQNPTA